MSDVDSSKPAHTYDFDSLEAMNSKNWFMREMKAEMQEFSLLGHTPIKEVGNRGCGKIDISSVDKANVQVMCNFFCWVFQRMCAGRTKYINQYMQH